MRPKDKPGTFRIVAKDGAYRVSGTTLEGERVRFTRATEDEAQSVARTMFTPAPPMGVKSDPLPTTSPELDDWGLPLGLRVSPSTLASFAPAATAYTPQAPATPGAAPLIGVKPLPTAQISAEAAKKKRRAESLAGMIGTGATMGIVYGSRKWIESGDAVPPKPDQKHTNELADSLKDGITSTFGDREVGPWTMALLLAITIPVSMKLQARKLTPEEIEERDKKRKTALRSIP